MPELVHKDLSYIIVGILFKIYNELGGGYQEKYYQKAIALELKKNKINFQQQVFVPLKYKEEGIGRYCLDFVIDNKIVLEIKVSPVFYVRDIKQILGYLKASGLILGILVSFTKNYLKFKRVLKGNKD